MPGRLRLLMAGTGSHATFTLTSLFGRAIFSATLFDRNDLGGLQLQPLGNALKHPV